MHELQVSENDQWHVGQEIRQVVLHESFVIRPCKPVWMYMGSEKIITTNTGPDVDEERLLVM
jgi:hypothetical protein